MRAVKYHELGAATRFLTTAAALVDGTVIVDGDEHMCKRPIGPLVEAMRTLGIDVSAETGCPPVTSGAPAASRPTES